MYCCNIVARRAPRAGAGGARAKKSRVKVEKTTAAQPVEPVDIQLPGNMTSSLAVASHQELAPYSLELGSCIECTTSAAADGPDEHIQQTIQLSECCVYLVAHT